MADKSVQQKFLLNALEAHQTFRTMVGQLKDQDRNLMSRSLENFAVARSHIPALRLRWPDGRYVNDLREAPNGSLFFNFLHAQFDGFGAYSLLQRVCTMNEFNMDGIAHDYERSAAEIGFPQILDEERLVRDLAPTLYFENNSGYRYLRFSVEGPYGAEKTDGPAARHSARDVASSIVYKASQVVTQQRGLLYWKDIRANGSPILLNNCVAPAVIMADAAALPVYEFASLLFERRNHPDVVRNYFADCLVKYPPNIEYNWISISDISRFDLLQEIYEPAMPLLFFISSLTKANGLVRIDFVATGIPVDTLENWLSTLESTAATIGWRIRHEPETECSTKRANHIRSIFSRVGVSMPVSGGGAGGAG